MSRTVIARIKVVTYTSIAIVSNYLLGLWIWQAETSTLINVVRNNYALVAMWIPGLIALGMVIITGEDIRKMGWRMHRWRNLLEAYFVPMAITTVVGVLALLYGGITWQETQVMPNLWTDIHGWFVIDTPVAASNQAWLPRMLIAGTIGIIPFLIHAFGEEIGWRGYLLPQLEQSGWRFPVLIQAIIWSQWHLPILLRTPAQTDLEFIGWLIRFTLGLTLLGLWIGYLYRRTRSLWIVTVAHASHNVFFTVWGISLADGGTWLAQESLPVIIGYLTVVGWCLTRERQPSIQSSAA